MPTSVHDASILVRLPMAIILRLVKDGIIENPVQDEELKGLMMISHLYGRPWYIRKLMAPLDKKRRLALANDAELTRPERYALSLYRNAKPGINLTTRYIVATVKQYLGVTLKPEQVANIRRIAYNEKRSASVKVL